MSLLFCCVDDNERISREIDRELERWKKDSTKEYKLLLLGTGEAGKSTFIKQMRIIHGNGYTSKDRKEFTPLVAQNIWMAVTALHGATDRLKIPYTDGSLQSQVSDLLNTSEGGTLVVQGHKDLIAQMWRDSGVQECFRRRNEFQISDSAQHYLDSLNRICESDYIPTVEDVLRVRVPTTGIIEYPFQMRRDLTFSMVDVGGQRTERRKWIHCFEGVKAIIFLVAISEYDQVLYEDWTQNRMAESLALFSNIVGYPFFASSSIILFLNKKDLFEEKIMHSHLADYYPDFKGPRCDPESGKDFILELFRSVASSAPTSKKFFHHFTCATDTENIKIVFKSVREQVLEDNLRDYNLM